MSETKAAYTVNADSMPTQSAEVRCTGCGEAMGAYIRQPDGRVWLLVGNQVLSSSHGRCMSCGTEFHWVASEKRLEDLLARLAKLRQEEGKRVS